MAGKTLCTSTSNCSAVSLLEGSVSQHLYNNNNSSNNSNGNSNNSTFIRLAWVEVHMEGKFGLTLLWTTDNATYNNYNKGDKSVTAAIIIIAAPLLVTFPRKDIAP